MNNYNSILYSIKHGIEDSALMKGNAYIYFALEGISSLCIYNIIFVLSICIVCVISIHVSPYTRFSIEAPSDLVNILHVNNLKESIYIY